MDNYNLTVGGKYITVGGKALSFSSESTVTIGGKVYKTTIMPDGHEWLEYNLDYAWPGLTVVSSIDDYVYQSAQAVYYDFDEATNGWDGNKYGLLYNKPARNYLTQNASTVVPGWHIPTGDEWSALFDACGDSYPYRTAATRLKSTSGWVESGNGDGSTNFAAVPNGFLYMGITPRTGALHPNFRHAGSEGIIWTADFSPSVHTYKYVEITSTALFGSYNVTPGDTMCAIRLVKDY